MSESKEVAEYYANKNRLILLHSRLHDALCKSTTDEYWSSSGACDIHPDIVHPEWKNIKERIYPNIMIWQIAYMLYPFRDAWETHNPFSHHSFFIERLQVMYQMFGENPDLRELHPDNKNSQRTKRQSTHEKEMERREIYQEVVEEFRRTSREGKLEGDIIKEAAKRANCSVRAMYTAISQKK